MCYNNKHLTSLKLFITRPNLINQRTSINESLETNTVFKAFPLLGRNVGDSGSCLPTFGTDYRSPTLSQPVQE